ncbi:hypothetical protein LX32DRAFT_200240 [Colletotrichum zoysiae]|uniref:Secreted protein n=1 Tax=Colletotrichum zoysiae TaxID=1216348 RepID=A0AAD9M7U4_9PEZI|nr:hypothetical protein LX32DRAFT_200240 [Colletotrichum zoysiae]
MKMGLFAMYGRCKSNILVSLLLLLVGTCMTVTCCRSLQGYCHSIKGTIAKCIVTQTVYGKVCVNNRRRLMLDTCVCALRIHSLLCKLGLPSGLRVGAATQVLFFF